MDQPLDPRLHFVVVTVIIEKDGKYLILKRAPTEKAFPNKWTVPGGKLVRHEYENLPNRGFNGAPGVPGQWYDVVDWVAHKEVLEEASLEIDKPQYLTDLIFIRPDGYPVVTLSYYAKWKSGEAKPGKDLVEAAWVAPEELANYDLIDGIADEIREVDGILQWAQV